MTGQAQPSGGPYGPIQRNYALPENAAHIYYVAPDGDTNAPGTTLAQPTTIESAVERVVTGDAIILRGGTYRTGGLLLNQGITMQPYADEHPVFKGTLVATNWTSLSNGLWRTKWSPLFPSKPADWWSREHFGKKIPLYRFNNDMVFVDGEQLKAVGWEGEVDEHSYYIDYNTNQVYISANPAIRLVEITAYDGAIIWTTNSCHGKTSDHKGPVIRGITFTQYAYRALEVEGKEADHLSDPATYGKDVTGTTLEDVTISHCSRVAGYFRGDRFTMRNCLVSDTRTEGVYIISSSDCLLEKNIFMRNNTEKIMGYFPGAVKIFNQCYRFTCRDNFVLDQPDSNGIWYDVGNVDGVFVNNWVQNCTDGFFFEISKNAVCAGNVFVNCEHGVRVLNSCNVRVYNNTLVNSQASFERTDRGATNDLFGWHASTGPDVDKRDGHVFLNNLLSVDTQFYKPLIQFTQAMVLCGKLTKPQVVQLDGNVYVRNGDVSAQPLIIWSPEGSNNCQVTFKTLEGLQKLHPEFEAHSLYLTNYSGSVLKCPALNNYELIRNFEGPASVSLPVEVRKLLGWTEQESHTLGAYPFRP